MTALPAMPMPAEPSAPVPLPMGVAEPEIVVIDQIVGDVPERLRRDWQALADDAAEANGFAEPWFVGAGLRNLAGGVEIRLIEVRRGGYLVGVLPVDVDSHYGRTRVANVQNWQHHHDFLGIPLIRAGDEIVFWRTILGHLDKAEWARGFLHVSGLVQDGPVHRGLQDAARALGRACPIVHRSVRAVLESDLSPQAYYESRVRKKKRKELKRLRARLEDQGAVTVESYRPGSDAEPWIAAFLALELAGWKGRAGSALSSDGATEAFFREAVGAAAAAGRLSVLRMDLDGRPLAMLVNFITPPGSFSFKIAFDETYARFSPGVLIQLENLAILDRPDIAWMDSCAVENHPMIDSLWGERRTLVRATVRLSGLRRGLIYYLCHGLEIVSAGRWALVKGIALLFAVGEVA